MDDEGCSPLDTRAILDLDLTKAFDNVRPESMLKGLERLGTGKRVYHYIRNLLSDRTASLRIGNIESRQFKMGSRGMPQGGVLSPFIFNADIMGLPDQLNEIATLINNLYADDETLWVSGGREGHVQGMLQSGIDAIIHYVRPRGLEYSLQKSELLIYRPTSRGRKPDPGIPNIKLYAGSQLIPTVASILILGLKIEDHGHNKKTIKQLEKSMQVTLRLIARVANRHMS